MKKTSGARQGQNFDDLFLAQRIRQGRLGESKGKFGPTVRGKPVARPVEVFFFRGASSQRTLVIAGVHGDERQGIEVARTLIGDLQKQQPHFTTLVVPALFPRPRGFSPAGEGCLQYQPQLPACHAEPSCRPTPTP